MVLLVIPAVLIAVISLASFAGGWVWWLDVLANFRAQYVAVLAVLGLVILASRWRRTGLAILGVALLNGVFVAPLFVGRLRLGGGSHGPRRYRGRVRLGTRR